MNKAVLDASALIAFIKREPGAEDLVNLLPFASLSAVNFCEVAAVLATLGIEAPLIETMITDLIGEVIPFDQEQAVIAAAMRETTKYKGLSLGDRACITLGIKLKAPIYTMDKVWKELKIQGADIRLLR